MAILRSSQLRELQAKKMYQDRLMGRSIAEIAKKYRLSEQTVWKRLKEAEKTDYVDQVRKRMQIAAADAGTVYEKLLRKRGWKKLSDTEKKLQVRVASDVLHGVGALTDEKQIQGDVKVEISVSRPPIAQGTGIESRKRAQEGQKEAESTEKSPNPPLLAAPEASMEAENGNLQELGAGAAEKQVETVQAREDGTAVVSISPRLEDVAVQIPEGKNPEEPPPLSIGGVPLGEVQK